MGNRATVEDFTAEATVDSVGDDTLRALLKLPGPGLQGMEVLSAPAGGGDTAAVEAGLLTFQPRSPGGPPRLETFTMENEGGDGRFAETES